MLRNMNIKEGLGQISIDNTVNHYNNSYIKCFINCMQPSDDSNTSDKKKILAIILLVIIAYTLGLFSSYLLSPNRAYRSKAAEFNPCLTPIPYVSVYPSTYISGYPPISTLPTPIISRFPTSYMPTKYIPGPSVFPSVTPTWSPINYTYPSPTLKPTPGPTSSACSKKCGYIGGVYYNQCNYSFEKCVNNCCQPLRTW